MDLETIPWSLVVTVFLGIAGPTIAYFAAKRMTEAKVRLIDIDAIKGWSEQRKSWEAEISQLHKDLDEERDLRREDKEKYEEDLRKLKDKIHKLSSDLKLAQETAEKYKLLLAEQSIRHAESESYHGRIDDIQNQISQIIIGGGDFNEKLKAEVILIRDNILELRKELKRDCPE